MADFWRKLRQAVQQAIASPAAAQHLWRRAYFERWLSWQLAPWRRSPDQDPYHQLFDRFLTQALEALEPPQILELGARTVTGNPTRDRWSGNIIYTGFDIHPGPNVDVVGDVHQLSRHVPLQHYDAIYSISVFEHLAMPWQAVLEINRVLKPGGLVFISTHPTWPAHELPWDFWRFNQAAFKALLNPVTGFEVLECVEGLPASIFPLVRDRHLRSMPSHPAYLGVAVLARKTSEPQASLQWNVPLDQILTDIYPAP